MDTLKSWLVIIGAFAIAFVGFLYIEELKQDWESVGYDRGYKAAQERFCSESDSEAGYHEGYEEGEREGYSKGYGDGYADCGGATYKEWYDKGYRTGYFEGWLEEGSSEEFDDTPRGYNWN